MKAEDRKLFRALRAPNATFFLGAGASWDCGLPLGLQAAHGIVQACFERIGATHVWDSLEISKGKGSWPRFEVVLDFIATHCPNLVKPILSSFRGIGQASTPLLLATHASPSAIWLTTNFDDQIEQALLCARRKVRVCSDRAQMASVEKSGTWNVFKLHGDKHSTSSEDLGIRIGQILQAFPKTAEKGVLRATQGGPIIFIGYAAADLDLRPMIRELIVEASYVAWITLGDVEDRVRNLLDEARDYGVFREGVPSVPARVLGVDPPGATHAGGKWSQRIRKILTGANTKQLLHVLADILMARDDEPARTWIAYLHRRIRNRAPRDHLLKLNREAEILMRRPDLGRRKRLEGGFAKLLEATNLSVRLEAMHSFSGYHWRVTGTEKAREILEAALTLAGDADELTRAKLLNSLGIVQVYQGGDTFEKGMAFLKESSNLARRCKDPILESEAIQRIAIGYIRLDQPNRALDLLNENKSIIEEIGSPRRNMAWMQNTAEALRVGYRFPEAIQMNREALAMARLMGDQQVQVTVMNNLGICLLAIGEADEADEAFVRSFEENRKLGLGEAAANAVYNRGWLRILLCRWREAEAFLDEAVTRYLKYGSRERAGGAAAFGAFCRLIRGDTHGAEDILKTIELSYLPSADGIWGANYRLARKAASSDLTTLSQEISEVEKTFPDDPEHCVYLFLFFLAKYKSQMSLTQRRETAQRAFGAVGITKLQPLFNALARFLEGYEDRESQAWAARCRTQASSLATLP